MCCWFAVCLWTSLLPARSFYLYMCLKKKKEWKVIGLWELSSLLYLLIPRGSKPSTASSGHFWLWWQFWKEKEKEKGDKGSWVCLPPHVTPKNPTQGILLCRVLRGRVIRKQLTTRRHSILHIRTYAHPWGLCTGVSERRVQTLSSTQHTWPFTRTSVVQRSTDWNRMILFQSLMHVNFSQELRGTNGMDNHQLLIGFGRVPELPYFLNFRNTLWISVHHFHLTDGKLRFWEEYLSTLPCPNRAIHSMRGKVETHISMSLFPEKCSPHSMQTNDDFLVIWPALQRCTGLEQASQENRGIKARAM